MAPKGKNIVAVAPLVILVLVGSIIFYTGYSDDQNRQAIEKSGETVKILSANTYGESEILLPAVDARGSGELTKLSVRVLSGSGETLTNIENLLFFVDTQFSIQTAKVVAANVTGIDLSNYNLVYDIQVKNSSTGLVTGPSAGAAITIATIAALHNSQIKPDVMITGTINADGTIGEVGGIVEKARAAKAGGARIFLVPRGEGIEQNFRPDTKCGISGKFTVCRTSYIPDESLNLGGEDFSIREVSNIQDALKYFLQ